MIIGGWFFFLKKRGLLWRSWWAKTKEHALGIQPMMGRDQGARAWHPAHGSASHRFGLEQTLLTSSSLHLNPHPPSDSLRSSRLFFLFLGNKEKQVIIITSYKWGQAYISFYLSLSGRRKVPLPYAASGAILRGPPRTTTHPRRGSRTARARPPLPS